MVWRSRKKQNNSKKEKTPQKLCMCVCILELRGLALNTWFSIHQLVILDPSIYYSEIQVFDLQMKIVFRYNGIVYVLAKTGKTDRQTGRFFNLVTKRV
jgi:exosome complex RNA-binding protein Rrp42 (RNase PH superfamily)